MSVQITIIGLGQVGSSIGLALAEQKSIRRVGHDKNYETARAAHKAGAVDETKINLPASVLDANIVLLCLPLSEVRETLKFIADDLQEGAVILDMAPAKAKVGTWVNEFIPHGRYYVGLSPAASPNYLHGVDFGVDAARGDLFKNGLFLVNAPSGTPGEAVKLATDLIELLGAQSLFTDPVEADGLLAATHLLPQLAAAALLDATVDQPGWVEARKVAARPYATVAAALAYHDEAKSLGEATIGNRENVIRVLDAYIASLQKLRDDIKSGEDQSVAEFIEDAVKAHDRWLHERTRADWQNPVTQTDSTRFGERMNQMIFGKLMDRNKKRK